jgi:hypothetical protein
MIECIELDGDVMITGGADGFIRLWGIKGLEYLELEEEDEGVFKLGPPLQEVSLHFVSQMQEV